MNLICFSFAFENTPLELREVIAFNEHKRALLQQSFIDNGLATESLILCTCNRTEIYLAGQREQIGSLLVKSSDALGLDCKLLEQHAELYWDEQAITHLFALACGLRSLVVGETEILSQIKSAYVNSLSTGTTGRVMNPLFQKAFAIAKKVRTGTDIGRYRVSVASVAVDQAARMVPDITSKRVAVWGTGQVGRAVVNSLLKRGIENGILISREQARVQEICPQWQWRHGSEITAILAECDIVFCCTGAPHPVITDSELPQNPSSLILFDLALPRDIQLSDPESRGCQLVDLEGLELIVSENQSARENAASAVLPQLQKQAADFFRCLNAQEHSQCIAGWRMQIHELLEEEMARIQEEFSDMNPRQKEQLELISKRLMHRMLHIPSIAMKNAAAQDLPCAYLLREAITDEL